MQLMKNGTGKSPTKTGKISLDFNKSRKPYRYNGMLIMPVPMDEKQHGKFTRF